MLLVLLCIANALEAKFCEPIQPAFAELEVLPFFIAMKRRYGIFNGKMILLVLPELLIDSRINQSFVDALNDTTRMNLKIQIGNRDEGLRGEVKIAFHGLSREIFIA